jgi:hypothetical protein
MEGYDEQLNTQSNDVLVEQVTPSPSPVHKRTNSRLWPFVISVVVDLLLITFIPLTLSLTLFPVEIGPSISVPFIILIFGSMSGHISILFVIFLLANIVATLCADKYKKPQLVLMFCGCSTAIIMIIAGILFGISYYIRHDVWMVFELINIGVILFILLAIAGPVAYIVNKLQSARVANRKVKKTNYLVSRIVFVSLEVIGLGMIVLYILMRGSYTF